MSPSAQWIVWLLFARDFSYRAISHSWCISVEIVSRVLTLFEATGEVSPNGPAKERGHLHVLDDLHEIFVIGLVLECPTLDLKEIGGKIEAVTNIKVCCSTVYRLLHRYGMKRKKVLMVVLQQSDTLSGQFLAKMLLFQCHTLVWLDETNGFVS